MMCNRSEESESGIKALALELIRRAVYEYGQSEENKRAETDFFKSAFAEVLCEILGVNSADALERLEAGIIDPIIFHAIYSTGDNSPDTSVVSK